VRRTLRSRSPRAWGGSVPETRVTFTSSGTGAAVIVAELPVDGEPGALDRAVGVGDPPVHAAVPRSRIVHTAQVAARRTGVITRAIPSGVVSGT
jgi:hypothetical protein